MAGGLEFCTVQTTARPFSLVAGGSTLTSLTLVATVIVTWEDGTTQDTWNPDGFSVTSAYDATVPTIDTTAWVWLVVAVKGVANSARLVKEADYANLGDTVLAGVTCQALYRIVGVDYGLFQEAASSSGSSLPQPLLDGALLYVDPITHQAVWVQGTQGDIWRYENGIWGRLPIGNLNDLLHVAMGPNGKRAEWIDPATVIGQVLPIDSGPTVATTLLSSAAARALQRWTGSANAAAPPGFETPSYNDSAWGHAVVVTATGVVSNFYGNGTASIWAQNGAISTTEAICLRDHISVPSGTITGGVLHIFTPTTGIWVNGNLITGSAQDVHGGVTLTVPASYLTANADNLLAIAAYNDGTAAIGRAAWCVYYLTVNTTPHTVGP